MDSRQDDLQLEVARLGVEAEAFMHSHVGRYLLERADHEIEINMVKLVEVDPGDYKANREIRNKIHVAKMFKDWIAEAIASGRVAHEAMMEQEAALDS